jgi:hypothetical protein
MDQINLLAISWNVRVLTLARALRDDVVRVVVEMEPGLR